MKAVYIAVFIYFFLCRQSPDDHIAYFHNHPTVSNNIIYIPIIILFFYYFKVISLMMENTRAINYKIQDKNSTELKYKIK